MDLFIIISLGILLFVVTNVFVFFFARGRTKRMIATGLIILLLSPLILYGSLEFTGMYDKGSGFGAALFALIYGGLYFLNGIVVISLSWMKSSTL
ncbi:hypothetical protein [Lysinibacillus sp. 54212]|uniref:hypothetical protein n=1 Tax=Lysinibacillus sp. 54212 TaxID=3119829 RepID=UPI002FC95188